MGCPVFLTFTKFCFRTFWRKKIFPASRRDLTPVRRKNLSFRKFFHRPLCDTSLESLAWVEHFGEKFIKIRQFLTKLWSFEVGKVWLRRFWAPAGAAADTTQNWRHLPRLIHIGLKMSHTKNDRHTSTTREVIGRGLLWPTPVFSNS